MNPGEKRMAAPTDKRQVNGENPSQIRSDLLGLVYQLETLAYKTDSNISREAFEALVALFHQVFTWLRTTAILSGASLGALAHGLPEEDARERYNRGEHAAAWAGVELARLYKHIKAELKSRSKHSVNRLRDLRIGFKLAEFDYPPNRWFREEYERRTDYRPTGVMAVWVARKVEEIRQLKTIRSMRDFARILNIGRRASLQPEKEIMDVVADWFPSSLVQGEALKRLDDLPAFGTSKIGDFEAWRKFVRRRVLTQKIITEFDALFPHSRKKLDGVIAATLRYAWQAVHNGGNVVLPEL